MNRSKKQLKAKNCFIKQCLSTYCLKDAKIIMMVWSVNSQHPVRLMEMREFWWCDKYSMLARVTQWQSLSMSLWSCLHWTARVWRQAAVTLWHSDKSTVTRFLCDSKAALSDSLVRNLAPDKTKCFKFEPAVVIWNNKWFSSFVEKIIHFVLGWNEV